MGPEKRGGPKKNSRTMRGATEGKKLQSYQSRPGRSWGIGKEAKGDHSVEVCPKSYKHPSVGKRNRACNNRRIDLQHRNLLWSDNKP